ncbi:MAG: D-alanyl-D-alanine carboxypeptidase [Caulobacteraceae bacterium]
MLFAPARRFAVLAGLFVLGLTIGLPSIAAAQYPYLRVDTSEPRYAAILMDASNGDILYSERADDPRYPASLTKLMTFYLTFQALASGRLHLDDVIVVSQLAADQPPTKLGLRPGATITVRDAMDAMAVHSANDMAVAIAERIGGSESRFADMMTLEAQRLGMRETRYVNVNGLPDNRQVTSAHDTAILVRSILRDFPQYYRFFDQPTFTYNGRTYYNTNHLLGRMPGVDGLKTGFTNAAGFNLAASAVRNGHRLIAIVLGGSSSAERNAHVENLLLTGFDIEERRDRGERVMLAQNAFEPAPEVWRPTNPQPRMIAAASEASDPIDVILTGATERPGAMTVSETLPDRSMLLSEEGRREAHLAPARPVEEPREHVTRREPRDWWVQVGRFHSSRQAKRQVKRVARRFSRQFDDADQAVDHGGRAWRARFTGLSQTAAEDACRSVRRQGLGCVVGRGV